MLEVMSDQGFSAGNSCDVHCKMARTKKGLPASSKKRAFEDGEQETLGETMCGNDEEEEGTSPETPGVLEGHLEGS